MVYFEIFCVLPKRADTFRWKQKFGSSDQMYFECWFLLFSIYISHFVAIPLCQYECRACPTSVKYGWGTDVIFLLAASLVIFIQSCSVIYAIIHFYFIHLNNESMWVWIFIWWKEVFRAVPNVTSVMEANWRLIQSDFLGVTKIYVFTYHWYILISQQLEFNKFYIG